MQTRTRVAEHMQPRRDMHRFGHRRVEPAKASKNQRPAQLRGTLQDHVVKQKRLQVRQQILGSISMPPVSAYQAAAGSLNVTHYIRWHDARNGSPLRLTSRLASNKHQAQLQQRRMLQCKQMELWGICEHVAWA